MKSAAAGSAGDCDALAAARGIQRQTAVPTAAKNQVPKWSMSWAAA